MIYSPVQALQALSRFQRLDIGDLLLTGTPPSGLILLLGGAVVVHLRNKDGFRDLVPALVLGAVAVTFVILVLSDVG